MDKKHLAKKIIVALVAAGLLTGAAAFGLLYSADNSLSDAVYQGPKVLGDQVRIIGIDAYSLEQLGPYHTWDRTIMARAIRALNADPDHRPAAIGIDVLYSGTSTPEADEALVSATAEYGNVVMPCAANFKTAVVDDIMGVRIDDFAIDSVDEPFPALKEVSAMGHINGMFDNDGIMRHNLLYLEPEEGVKIPGFSYELVRLYSEYHGLEFKDKPPLNSRNYWYLPFSGNPGDFYEGFSIADLLNGDLTGDMFEGCIVYIGPYATGLSDYFTTAIDHSELMYGVEYQANVATALLNKDFKKEVARLPQYIFLFAISFICVMLFTSLGTVPAAIVWAVLSGGYVGLAKLLYEKGYLVHLLWVPLALTIIFVSAVVYNYIMGLREKRKITNTFMRYVDPQAVKELLKTGVEDLKLGGTMMDVSVLFVDIRGFTTMSEALGPEEVVEIINKYLTLTTDCIIRHGGMLDKFVGDCTMAIFNAPLPQEDYIYKSVCAALDMVEGSKAVNEELERTYGRSVSFGIGVNCGPAVIGNIGSPMRMDYTAIGDTVNTSARLEANAPGGQIYISRAVADALEGRIRVTSLGDSIKLKGKAEGFEVLRLEGLAE